MKRLTTGEIEEKMLELLVKQACTQKELSQRIGVHPNTIRNTLRRFADMGIAKIVGMRNDAGRCGPRPYLWGAA